MPTDTQLFCELIDSKGVGYGICLHTKYVLKPADRNLAGLLGTIMTIDLNLNLVTKVLRLEALPAIVLLSPRFPK